MQGEGGFVGEVALTEPLGAETILHIRTGEKTLLSLVPGMANVRLGDQVRFGILRERLHFFDLNGRRI